jgi:signal transduction histidine kinase
MLDRLAASRERQRAFLADVAHELRSPLTSMRTQLEVAQRLGQRLGESDDLDQGLLEDVIRMSALVEDLLVMARLDSDAVPLPPAGPVDVADALGRASRRPVTGVPVEVAEELPDGLVVPLGPGELDRLLTNLVDNAVRHARSRVLLTAGRTPGGVWIAVDDDGPGIPEAERARMQERFTRLDGARARDSGGSGLGLAIVAALVERRAGRVALTTGGLGGLRVRVDFPGEF